MKTHRTIKSAAPSVLILLGAALLVNSPVQGAQPPVNWDDWDVVPGTVIIKYKAEKAAALHGRGGAANVGELAVGHIEKDTEKEFEARNPGKKFARLLPNTFVGKFSHGARARVLKALEADPDVEYFEPERTRVVKPNWSTTAPNDTRLGDLWGMRRIGASSAWARQSATRAAVRVGVLEARDRNTANSGIDIAHRDLTAQTSSVQNNPDGVARHATHVAGTIAATGNNRQDVAGVANVELVSMNAGAGLATRISWARNNGVRVMNMSWVYCGDAACSPCVYPAPTQTEQDAIRTASGSIVFVASAGNDACQTDRNGRSPIPASYDGVLAVSALAEDGTRATFSNFGSYIDLTAPGSNILSTIPNNQLARMDGTSMAAPHVAGTAAAVLAVRNNYDTPSLYRLLKLTAEDIGGAGRDDDFGYGVVRVDRAVAGIADVYAEVYPLAPNNRLGTLNQPLFFAEALARMANGVRLGLVRGASDVFTAPAATLTKPCTITSVGGPVRIVR